MQGFGDIQAAISEFLITGTGGILVVRKVIFLVEVLQGQRTVENILLLRIDSATDSAFLGTFSGFCSALFVYWNSAPLTGTDTFQLFAERNGEMTLRFCLSVGTADASFHDDV